MTLERYFRVSSYTLIVSSFVAIVSTGQLDALSIALYSGAVVAGWLVDGGMLWLSVSRRTTNWLRILYLPFLLLDWRILDTSPVIVVVHFILFVSACKLLEQKRTRDWLWVYLVAFFELLLAAGMTIDALFLVLLIIFLFAAISTLVSLEIRRAGEAFGTTDAPHELWRDTKNRRRLLAARRPLTVAGFSVVALVTILLLATPLFLAMPRLGRSAFGTRLLRAVSLSGFSNSVRLGEVAQVKLNPAVVMRVRVNPPPGQERHRLRWRGVTFDEYDGSAWTQSGEQFLPVRRYGNGFQISMGVPANQLTEQIFFLEPLDLSTVFVAPQPIWVGELTSLQRDEGDGLWTDNHAFQRFQYRVYSNALRPSEAALEADISRMYPPEIRTRYLQLPIFRDRRVDELAAEVTAGAITPLEIARRIETHLQTSYGYSLDLRRTTDGDPVADFLFNIRAGHCEYFATAMVLMLRARRIPARLVNGFQMGEYSEVANVYTVRQSDAHSWVEVYFGQNHWVAFDPTPAAGLSTYSSGWTAQVRQLVDAFALFWQERVVGFGTNDQVAMFMGLQRLLASYEQDPTRGLFAIVGKWMESATKWFALLGTSGEGDGEENTFLSRLANIASDPAALLFFGVLGMGLGGLVWRQRARSWRRILVRDRARSAIAFYQQMLSRLERAGVRRDPQTTPREFAATLDWPAVRELTLLYERARFSDMALGETEISRISRLLSEVRKATGHRWWKRWSRP